MNQLPTLTSMAQASAAGFAPNQAVDLRHFCVANAKPGDQSPTDISRDIRNAVVDELGHTIVFELRESGRAKWVRARLSLQFQPPGKPQIEATASGYCASVYYLADDAQQARSETMSGLDAALGRVAQKVVDDVNTARFLLNGMHVAERFPEPEPPQATEPRRRGPRP